MRKKSRKTKILLICPFLAADRKAVNTYGRGFGGYSTNFRRYQEIYANVGFESVPLTVRGEFSENLIVESFLRVIIDLYRISKYIFRKEKYRVHYVSSYHLSLIRDAIILCLLKISGHGITFDLRGGSFMISYHQNKAYEKLSDLILSIVDLIYIETQRNYLRGLTTRPVKYIPNFVRIPPSTEKNYTKFTPENFNKNSEIRLLYVGKFCKDKGAEILIETYSLLLRDFKNVRLDIIGSIEEDSQRYVFGAPANMYFHGTRKSDYVNAFYLAAHFYLYPSSHYGEGQNNSVTEAMSYGAIPLVSTKGYLTELVNESMLISRCNTSTDYYSKILDLVKRPNVARELSNNVSGRVRSFFSLDYVKQLINVK